MCLCMFGGGDAERTRRERPDRRAEDDLSLQLT